MERRDCFEDLTKEARDSAPSPGAPTHHKEALLLQLGSLLEAPSGVNAFLVSHLSAPSPITFYCHRGSWRKVTLSIWPRTTCTRTSGKRRDRLRFTTALHTGYGAFSAPSGLTPDRSLPARARSTALAPDRCARTPHLAQLLVDELLQLRGFLGRQRHAGAGASRPLLSASHGAAAATAEPVVPAAQHQWRAEHKARRPRQTWQGGNPAAAAPQLTVFKRCGLTGARDDLRAA